MKTRHTSLRRLGTGAATGALMASSLLLISPAAHAAGTVKVTNADLAPTEATYDGWHQGYADAEYASAITSAGLESAGKSQIINGYKNNSSSGLASDGVNADLSDDLVGATYTVAGEAFFQVPLFVDSDGAGANPAVFTTLRPAAAATGATTIGANDQWVSSKAFGTIAANTPAPLSTIISAIEGGPSVYKTIAFGVLTDAGKQSTVSSITFNGTTYDFRGTTSSSTVTNGQVAGEETSSNYASWHQGYANATKNQQVTAKGLELAGKSQVIKGFNNNSANVKAVNVNLAYGIGEASYTVEDGKAFFQIALFFDNGDGVKFATLRNNGETASANPHELSLGDDWQSSKAIGSIAANTDATLSDILGQLGHYKVIGYGVLTNQGDSAVVSNITFGGTSTTFLDAAATATTTNVTPNQLAANEDTFAGWHQGAETNTATIGGGALNLGADRSQVIKGYADNSKNTSTKNVDLAEALRTGSYTVKSGDVFFQVPVFFEDSNGDTQFATLRPVNKADVGVNTFSIGDDWVSSKTLGSLPANTPAKLGDILSSIGSYKVLAFGVYSDAGGAGVVTDITWDGVKNTFARVASTTAGLRFNITSPSVRSSVTVYAKVTAPGGAKVQGGAVNIKYRSKIIASGTVNSLGNVRITLPKVLVAGTRDIEVQFLGTSQALPSKAKKSLTVRK